MDIKMMKLLANIANGQLDDKCLEPCGDGDVAFFFQKREKNQAPTEEQCKVLDLVSVLLFWIGQGRDTYPKEEDIEVFLNKYGISLKDYKD